MRITTPMSCKPKIILRLVIVVAVVLVAVDLIVGYVQNTVVKVTVENTLRWIDKATEACKVGATKKHVVAFLGDPVSHSLYRQTNKKNAINLERYGQQTIYVETYINSCLTSSSGPQFWELNIYYDKNEKVIFYTLARLRT